jgi:transposase-like protein
MEQRRTKEEVLEAVEMIRKALAAGKTVTEIARQLDCSKQQIWEWCYRHNVVIKQPVVVKTEGLNWKHPPHIPFLPCR